MIKRIYILVILLCLILLGFKQTSVAQDFHLSQYEAAPMYLNPAMTGVFDGQYRGSLHYRNQWNSIAFKPFVSVAASFDMPLEKFNVGGYVISNKAGIGNYNAINLVGSAAYEYSKDNHNFSGGLQLGFIHKSVDIEKLSFANQYNATNGGSFDTGIGSGEVYNNTSIFVPESNLGLIYYYSKPKKRLNPFVGLSIFHLTQPTESFFDIDNKLPRRFLVHTGVKYNLTERIQFTAHYMIMKQRNAQEQDINMIWSYYMPKSNAYVIYGTSYRSRDAIMAHFGLKYKSYTYRFSYDINRSDLTTISNGKGAFEMSIVYTAERIKTKPVIACPRL